MRCVLLPGYGILCKSIDYAGAATVVHEVTEPLVVTQDARIIQDAAVVPDSAATQNSVVDQDGMIMHDGETTQGCNLVQGHAATQDSRLRSGEVLEPEAAEPRATSQQRRADSTSDHESILGLEPQSYHATHVVRITYQCFNES